MGILSNIATTCIRTSDGRREPATASRCQSHFCLVPINKCLFSPAPSDQRRGTDVSSKLQEITVGLQTSPTSCRRYSVGVQTSPTSCRRYSVGLQTSPASCRRYSVGVQTSPTSCRRYSVGVQTSPASCRRYSVGVQTSPASCRRLSEAYEGFQQIAGGCRRSMEG